MKKAIPQISNIGVLYTNASEADYKSLAREASKLGVKITGVKVTSSSQLTSSFLSIINNVDAFWLLFDPLFLNPTFIKFVILQCVAKSKPFVAFSPIIVKAGALIAVAPDYALVGKQAAKMVNKILSGIRPDHIPVEEPKKQIYINGIIAEKIGLRFPAWVLKEAVVFK